MTTATACTGGNASFSSAFGHAEVEGPRLAIWRPTTAPLSNLRAHYRRVACGGGLHSDGSRGDLLGSETRGSPRHSLRPPFEQPPSMARALAPCSSAFTARACAPQRLASAHVLPAASSGLVQRRAAAGLAGEGARSMAAAGNAAAQASGSLCYRPPACRAGGDGDSGATAALPAGVCRRSSSSPEGALWPAQG